MARFVSSARNTKDDGDLPPVPRTDATLPLWQKTYDDMRPAFEKSRGTWGAPAQGPDPRRMNIDPEAIRERAWMAQVDREYRRRYWSTKR